MCEVEIWVMVDEDGDYAIAKDNGSLAGAYDNDIGGDRDTLAMRLKTAVKVPLPTFEEFVCELPVGHHLPRRTLHVTPALFVANQAIRVQDDVSAPPHSAQFPVYVIPSFTTVTGTVPRKSSPQHSPVTSMPVRCEQETWIGLFRA